MKIPKTFTLKGKQWKVEYKWNLHEPDIGPCTGLCDFNVRTIFIDRLASAEDKENAFIHELIHAAMFEAHLHEAGGVDGFMEEVICECITTMLFDLFELRWRKKK